MEPLIEFKTIMDPDLFSANEYPKMTSLIANRNLAQIAFFVEGNDLKSSKKGAINKPKSWMIRLTKWKDSPKLDPAAIEKTYYLALTLKQDHNNPNSFSRMELNFDASFKGLDELINHYKKNNDEPLAARITRLRNNVLTALAKIELQPEVVLETPPPPPPPAPPLPPDPKPNPGKLTIRRRHQSVQIDVKTDYFDELFKTIKEKVPLKKSSDRPQIQRTASYSNIISQKMRERRLSMKGKRIIVTDKTEEVLQESKE